MKILAALFIIFLMVFSLIGCGGGNSNQTNRDISTLSNALLGHWVSVYGNTYYDEAKQKTFFKDGAFNETDYMVLSEDQDNLILKVKTKPPSYNWFNEEWTYRFAEDFMSFDYWTGEDLRSAVHCEYVDDGQQASESPVVETLTLEDLIQADASTTSSAPPSQLLLGHWTDLETTGGYYFFSSDGKYYSSNVRKGYSIYDYIVVGEDIQNNSVTIKIAKEGTQNYFGDPMIITFFIGGQAYKCNTVTLVYVDSDQTPFEL